MENKPKITYRKNDNWGVTSVFYGRTTNDLENMEEKLREKLMEIAIEKNYSEIEIIDTDYCDSENGLIYVNYRYEKAE
jgi:hypothetical protein